MLCVAVTPVNAQDALRAGFKNPPPSAKARTWWHWINGNVSSQGITADLEAMKRVGIQEAQIFNVDQGYPDGSATFLSPKWLELFQFAASEAKRLGLEIGFNNSAGWSSSGGPWVTPENAMQTVVYSQTQLKGGNALHQKLPQPATKLNYYKDIAVIAFPTPKGNQRIDQLDIKALKGDSFKTHLDPSDKIIDRYAVVDRADIIDLTSRFSGDGTLNWTAPAGNWTVLRFGHTPTGTENRPAGLGGKGLEVDKMSRSAVDAYWAGGIQPILDKLGPLVGTSLTNCLIDSYEVGCNNWTSTFREDFKKRCTYDCLAFLPTLAGYYVESGEVSERFLWDFRKTIGDLIAANYYGYFSELCHKSGMKFSVEPYGGPFESLKAGSSGDVVMGEFWLGRKDYLESPKLAASISHLNGNSVVGAESFTSMGGWLNHPATLKPMGDFAWTEGVNRLIFHTYAHQPWNIAPGVTFHMYGVEMSRLNTWWEQSYVYMNYLARSQFLLQQGHSFADVLVFTGESSPNDAILRSDIKALGYDYDQIGPDQLAYLTAKDGKIYTRNGLSYHMLILPETNWATPELLLKIKELVLAGAVVSGTKPNKSPSLIGYPACDAKVTELADQIWNNKILDGASASALLKELDLAPDFSGGPTGSDLNFIHRVMGDDDIYFVSNPKNESRKEICKFRITGKKPMLWNPETGAMEDVLVWKKGACSTTEVPISFNGNGAVFVVFHKTKSLSFNHITSTTIKLDPRPLKPLLDLQVLKAEYGAFLPNGTVDVTTALAGRIAKDGVHFSATNDLTPFDPAPGSVKELRVEYELAGKRYQFSLLENEQKSIDPNGQAFKLIRGVYGKFPQELKGLPPQYPVHNVTMKVSDMINSNIPVFKVTDSLFRIESDGNDGKRELRLVYSTAGETIHATIQKGMIVHLEQDTPEPRLVNEKGVPTWITPYSGNLIYIRSSGVAKTIKVSEVQKPLTLSGPWELSFPRNLGAPPKAIFDKLISWSLSPDDGIRYFSGTASYKKQFIVEDTLIKKGSSMELDLGNVRVIAEVILNGKNLGVLWKPPFRVNLTGAVRAGPNKLEVRITNLWPNRLIGDEHLSKDVTGKYGIPDEWPKWLLDPAATRSSKRITFTTWKHWDENSKLQTSGLLGPVILRFYKHQKLIN